MFIQKSAQKSKREFMKASDGVLIEYSYFNRQKDETIVFLNGWGTASFSEWAKQLRISEFNLLMHNNRGMGRSGLGKGDYLMSSARDIDELCQHLGIGRMHIVGHSMGGLVGTLFHRYKGSDVSTMTYVCTPDSNPVSTFPFRKLLLLSAEQMADSYADGFLGHVASLMDRSRSIEHLAFLASKSLNMRFTKKEFSRFYHNFLQRREAVSASLKSMLVHGDEIGMMMREVDIPTLIIAGEKDFLVDPQTAQRLHHEIPGSELHVFKESTHAPMFEQPKRFNRTLIDFIQRRGDFYF
jgi:pimeloyl-ACP methyl ester carboxylesterase